MKLSTILLLLITSSSFAGSAQVANGFQVGVSKNTGSSPTAIVPNAQSSISTIKTLSMFVTSSTASHFYGLYLWGPGGGQYKVPAGKTTNCTGLMTWEATAPPVSLVFGTSTAPFSDNATSVSSPVYFSAASGVPSFISDTASSWQHNSVNLVFGPTLYPFVQTVDSSVNWNVLLQCVEQ